MGFELPALPSFQTNIPQMPSALDQYGKMLQLKSLQGQQQLQQQQIQQNQQLQPLRVQQAQQATQAGDLENQQKQLELQSQQAMMKAWSDPKFLDKFTGTDKASSSGLGFDPDALSSSLITQGVLPKDAMAMTSSFVERSQKIATTQKDIAQTGEAQAATRDKGMKILADKIGGVLDLPASKAPDALAALKQDLVKNPQVYAGVPKDDLAHLYGADLEHLPAMATLIGLDGKIADFHKSKAEAAKAEQGVIPANGGLSPDSQQQVDKDVAIATNPKIQAGKVQLAKETEKARVDAEAGDPTAMGVMMAKGMVAPSEIISKFKPELTQRILAAADAASQKLYGQPFNAEKAEAQYNYAKNPATQNTLNMITAMTDKGGSIEIAKKAAEKLPKFDEGTTNKVFNAVGREFGSADATNFHTAMLGLADEYSKVMGGGVSSDTGRQQALDILQSHYSSGQLSGAIDIIEQDLRARKGALVRDNPTLNALYPEAPKPKTTASASITKTYQGHTYAQQQDGSWKLTQ